ncbi:MAG: hypothetical protein R3E94_00765 [Burkholderiaceae bacterium]
MATPNYGYEKRQRELAKKQKKEEKLRAKNARRQGAEGSSEVETDSGQENESGNAEGSSGDGAD